MRDDRLADDSGTHDARRRTRAEERRVLGRAIRSLRRTQKRTLADVAGEAGVSPSLLSQIERGIVSPSLDSLRDIAEALGTAPFKLLVDGGVPAHVLVRRDERVRLPLPEFVEFELLSPSLHGAFEVGRWTLGPGQASTREARPHAGEEANLITGGRVRLELGGEMLELEEGDFIAFDARLPHRVVVLGTVPASAVFIISPPAF